MEDKYSCEYDVKKIRTDPRFVHCRKDMITVQIVYFSFTFLLVILSYALSPADMRQMPWLFGLPLWVAATTLVTLGYIVFVVIWALTRKKFSLEARGDDSEVDY